MILDIKITNRPAQPSGTRYAESGAQDFSSSEFDQAIEADSIAATAQNEALEAAKIEESAMLQVLGKTNGLTAPHKKLGVDHLGAELNQMRSTAETSHPDRANSKTLGSGSQNVEYFDAVGIDQETPAEPGPQYQTSIFSDGGNKGKIELSDFNLQSLAGKPELQAQTNLEQLKLLKQKFTQTPKEDGIKAQNELPKILDADIKPENNANIVSQVHAKLKFTGSANPSIADILTLVNGNSAEVSGEPAALSSLGTQSLQSPLPFSENPTMPSDIRTLPQRTIQLIAQAASALQDRPVELTLNPEELGRVRMTLRSTEGSMMVTIAVERPETLDLLRRNIDQLGGQLRDIGYEHLSFEFAGQGSDFSDGTGEDLGQGSTSANSNLTIDEKVRTEPVRIDFAPENGIDIRL